MLKNDKEKKNGRPRRIGLKDVAQEAGVDVSTVSRILGGSEALYSDTTCLKVREAAEKLNYRPNTAARSMATGSTRMVGVTVSGSGFLGRVVEGINEALIEHGHLMLHAWNPETYVSPENPIQKKIIHELVERQVEGVILRVGSEEFEQAYFQEIYQRGIPMIVIDREMAQFKTDFVGSDDVSIGRDAALHFLELGHRRLLFIGEKENVSTARLREQGFVEAVREADGAVCKKVDLALNTTDTGELIATLQEEEYPTAVFCYSEGLVPSVYQAIKTARLNIPSDISVLSCGNLAWSQATNPALTTFDQHPEEIGRRAVELYLERISDTEKKSAPREIRVTAHIVERESTAPAPE
ncbi:HTH-type transcriptional repressor CytR [Pontiella desulfatans]|uniref:HTH-type transcriptional repressor CytR n=1 Tax=Pontiella desulfatans TaxID=2750659 RepID=A0A6C2UB80_PONDE|nr:LacI family DNA-binding transcriptional regulator [Pontiella desulfatans]VGO16897.1 HTH-type transcriptional repressor CytR [Pontiella desulfatans]